MNKELSKKDIRLLEDQEGDLQRAMEMAAKQMLQIKEQILK